MNILYIAYSCSPYHGSEDKIGWNVPVMSAKVNKVFVITKEEQRQYISEYLRTHQLDNIEFFYVDIPSIYKRLFSGALYSGRLAVWNECAFRLAKKICRKEHIDIIHQITPVEFRNIGNYGNIPDVKFVCGPVGGGETVPQGLRRYIKNHTVLEYFRSVVNCIARLSFRFSKKLKRIDALLFANVETWEYLKGIVPNDNSAEIMAEISVEETKQKTSNTVEGQSCRFIVVGRLIYRKGHALLLDAFSRLPKDCHYVCHVVGKGKERNNLERKCKEYGLQDKVLFDGAVPHTKIMQIYDSSDVLLMPSLRETTGSVVLEAMSKGLPVITINRFGGATILDQQSGWLYDGDTEEQYVENLASTIMSCIRNPKEVCCKGQNAFERAKLFTWEKRAKKYQDIYERVLSKGKVHV